jgi:hypothetical protein
MADGGVYNPPISHVSLLLIITHFPLLLIKSRRQCYHVLLLLLLSPKTLLCYAMILLARPPIEKDPTVCGIMAVLKTGLLEMYVRVGEQNFESFWLGQC